MIPVSTLYDENIERRKFTEQKKPFEYIVPPPLKRVGTIKECMGIYNSRVKLKIIHILTSQKIKSQITLVLAYQKNNC